MPGRQHYGKNDFYSGTDTYQEDPNRYIPDMYRSNTAPEYDPMYSKLDDEGTPLWTYGTAYLHKEDTDPITCCRITMR